MINIYSKICLFFGRLQSNKLTIFVFFLFFVLFFPHVSFGDNDITKRLSELEAQYKTIKTIHVKYQVIQQFHAKETDIKTKKAVYEYWADDHEHYRGDSFIAATDESPANEKESATNGKIWQFFDKTAGLMDYATKFKKEGNPSFCLAYNNPMFLPLSFLERTGDENWPLGRVLQLMDVLNHETWQEQLVSARIITVPDQAPNQMVVEINGGIMELGSSNTKTPFDYYVYFSNSPDLPDFLPIKINSVDKNGKIFSSLEFTYQPMYLDGKQTYWIKSARIVVTLPVKGIETTIYDWDVKTDFLKINQELPSDIFTLDISSAQSIWDGDLKMFIKQRGSF